MPQISDLQDPEFEREHAALRARDELSRLLDLAEKIQERIAFLEGRLRVLGLTELVMLVSVVGVGIFSLRDSKSSFDSLLDSGLFVAFFAASVIFLLATRSLAASIRRRARPERRALGEVVSLLREASGGIAQREGWSALQLAEFRIRLSRFDMALEEEATDWLTLPFKVFFPRAFRS